ncbi:MAG: prolyl oligopeptidase family serine peptidase [Pseudomonadota bacterium]
MNQTGPIFLFATLLAALGGCGSGGSTPAAATPAPSPAPVTPTPPTGVADTSGARGALLFNPPPLAQSLDPAGLVQALGLLGRTGAQILSAAGQPKCSIDFHQFEYSTVGAGGETTTASGSLMVPNGADPACSGKRPVLMYGHGSSLQRNVRMGDLSPNAPYSTTSATAAALYAAQGYIVIAPNYAGYDTSTLSYHAHHVAEQNAKDMIDALTAARKAFAKLPHPVADSGKLFLTGYSEGGYVTMATQRAMQAAGISVTAAAPLSGNYAESVSYETSLGSPDLLRGLAQLGADAMLDLTLQFTAWQKAYGNLYAAPTELYQPAYAASMETLAPTLLPINRLIATGKLPPHLLANDMPGYAGLPAAEQAAYGTPDTSLLKSAYLTALLNDIVSHPCPVGSSSAPLDCAHAHPMRAAWFKNDLRTWVPTTPLLMCGGNGDGVVPFNNATLTQAYFNAHGVGAGLVTVLDVDTPVLANDPYAGAKNLFAEAKRLVIAGNGNPADPDTYHDYLAFAGCNVAARDFFKAYQ